VELFYCPDFNFTSMKDTSLTYNLSLFVFNLGWMIPIKNPR